MVVLDPAAATLTAEESWPAGGLGRELRKVMLVA